jgi:hypothetical protein
MTKKKEDSLELPADLKKEADNVDPEEPKAVLKIVLDAFERGVKLGRELNPVSEPPKKKGFWD